MTAGPPASEDLPAAERVPPAAGHPTPAAGHATPAREDAGGLPLRVTTIELFFDLVFAFTLTQLTALLGTRPDGTDLVQVLLIFGLLWWMYDGYAWLTNTRAPARTAERLLLLVGMAGFLIAGLAIPRGFGSDGLALGLGYLVVVLVHASLYFRLNRNIVRIAMFNLTSALLVVIAGIICLRSGSGRPAGPALRAVYPLWALALAVQVGSPLITPLRGRFEIQPSHFVERHGALVIVAIGESIAAIGIGARGAAVDLSLVTACILGLALAAVLWWAYFGAGDDDRADRAMAAASPADRPGLALSAFFYAHIPILLGIVGVAAGVMAAISSGGQPQPAAALSLGGGTALFLGGQAAFRRALRIGPVRLRAAGAAFALATSVLGATVAIEAQLAAAAAGLAAILVLGARAADGATAPGAKAG